ncbi:MAG: zinc-binding alcohol dehydrogenase [Verrucomicrobiota bacterium]|nr:zinc-binding alcohol dehydrogenase [Verrucomicrobiota bacterium]
MLSPCLLFSGINQVTLGETDIPAPLAGEVLIETHYSCISPGTELRCLAGKQSGAPAWPYVPGYASSGKVIATGTEVQGITVGDAVFYGGTKHTSQAKCWGGHTGLAVADAASVSLVPPTVSLDQASLAKLAAISYRGVRLSKAQPHEVVLVVGLGPIGMLSALLHNLTGARVIGLDLSPERVALAHSLGLEAYASTDGIVKTFRSICPAGADVVVDSTGFAPVLTDTVLCAKDKPWDNSLTPAPRLIVQGSYAGDLVFPHGDAFMREMEVHFPRDSQPRDVETIISLLARNKLNFAPIIGGHFAPAECATVYERLRTSKGAFMTAVFKWR